MAQEQGVEIRDFLEQNCIGCHDSGTTEGDLNLEALKLDLDQPENFHHWERVFDRVRDGEMPPDEELDRDEKQAFISSLGATLHSADASHTRTLGRVPARRLTRAQYERNVCDLLQVDVPLQVHLPEESLSDGFDTVSRSQQISDHSLAAYLNAADIALDAAFERLLTESPPTRVRLDWKRLQRRDRNYDREPEGRPDHEDVVAWATRQPFYGRMRATTVDDDGRYRIKVRVQAVNAPKGGSVWCVLQSGVCNNKASTLYWIGSFEATSRPNEYQFDAWIQAGHKLRIVPGDSALKKAGTRKEKGHVDGPSGFVEKTGAAGVAIQWIEMERLDDRVSKESREALIGKLRLKEVSGNSNGKSAKGKSNGKKKRFEIIANNEQRDLENLLLDFARRAFRRPVEPEEVQPYVDFASERLKDSESFLLALRAGYRAILCSSRFLYFEETPGKLDDHALASRLSHFLWGVGPDRELRKLADAGSLGDTSVLAEQVDRLLKDDRSTTFIHEFSDQWLKLVEINDTTPDEKLYPEYDDVLHQSMLDETHAFVREMVDNDLSVTNVVDSDFTFLNSRLARHYNIKWKGGTGMERVRLKPAYRRGGIITHASVLKVTANGTTTSPILRGVWMLERVIGLHVPPPPPNVPAVEPDIRGATSIRDQLKKHRSLESCATCHIKIDPPGFALESYDVIGGWREKYRAVSAKNKNKRVDGLPVDPSYEFPSGKRFKDVDGLKKLLLKKPEQLARNFVSQLLTYATGSAPTFADRSWIDKIVKSTQHNDYGVRSIIRNVVLSPQFRYK